MSVRRRVVVLLLSPFALSCAVDAYLTCGWACVDGGESVTDAAQLVDGEAQLDTSVPDGAAQPDGSASPDASDAATAPDTSPPPCRTVSQTCSSNCCNGLYCSLSGTCSTCLNQNDTCTSKAQCCGYMATRCSNMNEAGVGRCDN